ncbi:MAG: hypothetical protein CMO68_06045 [Verrucomicrobiales bacterium]|nr:hypothetical protein [Verrucomicrobiales bacterium]
MNGNPGAGRGRDVPGPFFIAPNRAGAEGEFMPDWLIILGVIVALILGPLIMGIGRWRDW